MKINDSSDKPYSLYHDALFWIFGTRTASTSQYDISDFIASANFACDSFVVMALRASGFWRYDDANNTDLPIATAAIVSGQSNYAIPDAHMVLRRVRVKDQSGAWHTLDAVSRESLTDEELSSTGFPTKYYRIGRSIFLVGVPTFNQDASLEIQFQRGTNYFVENDTIKEPGFDNVFHRWVSLNAALDHFDANPPSDPKRQQRVLDRIEKMKTEVEASLATRGRDDRPRMTVRIERSD